MAEPTTNRFALVEETYDTVIRDVEHGLNLFFVAESGHGLHRNARAVAVRVVEFLNSLPPEQTDLLRNR